MSGLPYIGVTGLMSTAETQATVAAFPATCDRALMIGVLASSKTLAGQPNKWPLRYPLPADIASIFSPDSRALNLVHYATGGEHDGRALADAFIRAMVAGGPLCHGLQINAAWPTPRAFDIFRDHYPQAWVVLQIGPSAMRELDHHVLNIAQRVRRDYGPVVTDLLIDASGGTGRPLDTVLASQLFDALKCAGDWGVGVAGGLCAGALARTAPWPPSCAMAPRSTRRDGCATTLWAAGTC